MIGGGSTTQFGILGPLDVWRDGQPVELTGLRVRLLLALLVLNAGHVVPTARLIDGLWGEATPPGAANALQALVSRLRAALGRELVESRTGGYRLAATPDAVDAQRFERHLAEGRAALAAGYASSSTGPQRRAPTSGSRRTPWPPWSRSAAASTGCRPDTAHRAARPC